MSTTRANLALSRLIEIMARLRGPGGCPWDAAQTSESLRPYLVEETYEVLEAIDRGDAASLREELGDLLLQIVFHARIAEEQGEFDIAEVAEVIAEKLVRRHPHVFAGQPETDPVVLAARWESIKAAERQVEGGPSVLAGIPRHLPALQRACKVTGRSYRAGLPKPGVPALLGWIRTAIDRLEAALQEGVPDPQEEYGNLLLVLSTLAHPLGADPEDALRQAVNRMCDRLVRAESEAVRQGRKLAEILEEKKEDFLTPATSTTPPPFRPRR